MRKHIPTILVVLVVAGISGLVLWIGLNRAGNGPQGRPTGGGVAAVEVGEVTTGSIRDIRRLTGTIEASASFVVAARVDGVLENVFVNIGDTITRGDGDRRAADLIAEIDDAAFEQAVLQASADLLVRKAELARAESDFELAGREYARQMQLSERGIAAEARLDEADARRKTTEAMVSLSKAQVERTKAALELAQIQKRDAQVTARWSGGPETGTVGERFRDPGATVRAGDPIISVLMLDPVRAVVTVTERDYSGLRVGQKATLTTDGAPGRVFEGTIERIAPLFRETSRQARIELRVENSDLALRPGMFTRVNITLREEEDVTIIPLAAVTQRRNQDVVFRVSDDGETVSLVPVRLGIVEGDRAQVIEPAISGRVVTLGQQLLDDGTKIRISDTVFSRTAPASREESEEAEERDETRARVSGGAS